MERVREGEGGRKRGKEEGREAEAPNFVFLGSKGILASKTSTVIQVETYPNLFIEMLV
jgi:hypothetical protein